MGLRVFQKVLGVANCAYGVLLLSRFGRPLLHLAAWPPTLEQQVILLVAGSVLPIGLIGLRFPLFAGIAEFACAYIGNQMLHEAPLTDLRFFSTISMAAGFTILAFAVFHGILEVTREAFGQTEDTDEKRAQGAA